MIRWRPHDDDFHAPSPDRLTIDVVVHEIEGGGFWGEVPRFPGCLAQADTEEALRENILQALQDWWAEAPEKTEAEAAQLAAIQGGVDRARGPGPQPYDFHPSLSWSEDDE
jgi:predicted RNase H-like HicB family nuclease